MILLLIIAILLIVLLTARWNVHPFIALMSASVFFGISSGLPPLETLKVINDGFGKTIGYIGIVIILGSIIGTFLEKSGGASKFAELTLRHCGKKLIPLSTGGLGFVVSIPVFCDSAFVLLSSMIKSLSLKSGISLATIATSLSMGLYVTHTMVPPTPGPVAAAGILKADIGLVVMYGLTVGIVAMLAGVLFATIMGKRISIQTEAVQLNKDKLLNDSRSGIFLFLPIVIPILFILLKSFAELPSHPFGVSHFSEFCSFIGHPVSALTVGTILSFFLPKKWDKKMFASSGWVGEAIKNAAPIIIITGAGGAFGKVLQASEIGNDLSQWVSGLGIGLGLPFFIAALLKTAQGSSTVAIITTAGLIYPMLEGLGLQSDHAKALVTVAIGAGAMLVSHANDSYFWVVTQFSGFRVEEGLKLHSLGTVVVGMVAMISVYLISLFVL